MILEKHNLQDKLRLEIVNGADIVESYKNKKYVSSCMSNRGRWKYTNLYKYIDGLSLLRIMKGDDLRLRALIWSVLDEEGSKFKFLDRVYDGHSYCECTGETCKCILDAQAESLRQSIRAMFPSLWPKYADVRNTAKTVVAKILPNKVKIWPSLDSLVYYNKEKRLLSNSGYYKGVGGFRYYNDYGVNIQVATEVVPA